MKQLQLDINQIIENTIEFSIGRQIRLFFLENKSNNKNITIICINKLKMSTLRLESMGTFTI